LISQENPQPFAVHFPGCLVTIFSSCCIKVSDFGELNFFFVPLKPIQVSGQPFVIHQYFFPRCVVKEARLQQQDRRSFHGRAEQVLYSF